MNPVHATCVAIEGIGVLIRGKSGSGKSDLALRLMDEGAILVCDDYCMISSDADKLTASAPENIKGKIEVRGYGIVNVPYMNNVAVELIVNLESKEKIERAPEFNTCTFKGIELRSLVVDPKAVSATAKIRLALRFAADNQT